ncbi:hypothetical protein K435DRAFT_837935 [Dendrothele bispora CBS 962.96]|uniref:Uncharacterized protein n=1 Tax=Dendrothele bispora (strain CBS 962.96) TaxID=1314807 RepID=A0A4S8MA75_DENBC|nr:hypothetical protein K435DRAFT_837935 [Dendrothele bispora CBS 962.96]
MCVESWDSRLARCRCTVLYSHPSNATPEKLWFQQKVDDGEFWMIVFYGVNKDGVKVAVFSFTKSAYGLGGTVQDAAELNERTSRAWVVEQVQHSKSNSGMNKRLAMGPQGISMVTVLKTWGRAYSTHRTSNTTASTTVSTPGQPPGGLEWKARTRLSVATAWEESGLGPEELRGRVGTGGEGGSEGEDEDENDGYMRGKGSRDGRMG